MEYRAYSISSIPNQEFLQLTIKRVEGGKVSNYLIDQLNEGDEVAVLAPTGPFNSIDCKPRKKSGVTQRRLWHHSCHVDGEIVDSSK